MTDREMLELAAKAAGIDATYRRSSDCFYYDNPESGREQWNPLTDDGDALRMAVKLQMEFAVNSNHAWAQASSPRGGLGVGEYVDSDAYSAVRRAIVRAAAEVGRRMP